MLIEEDVCRYTRNERSACTRSVRTPSLFRDKCSAGFRVFEYGLSKKVGKQWRSKWKRYWQ